ncbi:MAG TPA: hypothetical protein VJ696_05830, partial [Rhodanobacteraceae bacterium]|nr:hypothetical protein [Rhodanobacteraceae bacterium]
VAIGVAPARVVVVRPARVWVPGYWRYSHARRVWVAGYWSHRAYRPVRRIGMPRWRVRAGYRAW